MNHISSLLKVLASSSLFISREQYITELAIVAPYFLSKKDLTEKLYKELITEELNTIKKKFGFSLSTDFSSPDLPQNSVAYHRVFGTITSDSYYRFSSKQLQSDIIEAENNDNISAHFIHITSGGGEAWYLDQLALTIREAKKPTFAFIEKVAASAGYYIASQAQYVSAATPYDLIGCIGVMVSFMDMKPMLEKLGINFIEEYATESDLKNKKYNDLRAGKPKQFIHEELNPLREQFVLDVRSMRSAINSLPLDHPVLRGETFYANKAIENGLIDTIETFDVAIERAYNEGVRWKSQQTKRRMALHSLK